MKSYFFSFSFGYLTYLCLQNNLSHKKESKAIEKWNKKKYMMKKNYDIWKLLTGNSTPFFSIKTFTNDCETKVFVGSVFIILMHGYLYFFLLFLYLSRYVVLCHNMLELEYKSFFFVFFFILVFIDTSLGVLLSIFSYV